MARQRGNRVDEKFRLGTFIVEVKKRVGFPDLTIDGTNILVTIYNERTYKVAEVAGAAHPAKTRGKWVGRVLRVVAPAWVNVAPVEEIKAALNDGCKAACKLCLACAIKAYFKELGRTLPINTPEEAIAYIKVSQKINESAAMMRAA